jgi:iron(III) transport system ATP-binding protein
MTPISNSKTSVDQTAYLEINQLECGYSDTPVINGISFSLERGQIGCLLGPSGCGKSTALRAIAGFLKPSSGTINVNGRCLSDQHNCLPPEKRNLGMVFQDYALFPHMTVRENLGFGLNKLSATERQSLCDEYLELIHMTGYAEAYPSELSGGQQQRVAVARSLAIKPDILLLDEPFSGLDVELRRELNLNVRDILKKSSTTALLVTHDQEEAFAVADRIGVMRSGKLYQWDTAYNLYHRPGHRFVANFVGRGSFIPGRVTGKEEVDTELGKLRGVSQSSMDELTDVELLVRPDDVRIDSSSAITGKIERKLFIGTNTLYRLRLDSGNYVETMLPSHEDYDIGSVHGLRIDAPHLIVFPRHLGHV